MQPIRLLAFSDEVSLIEAEAQRALHGFEFQVLDATDVSRDLAKRQAAHGLVIDVAPSTSVASLAARLDLGIPYSAVVLYSLRVWNLARTLLGLVHEIRAIDTVTCSGLRAGALPIVLMNPLQLAATTSATRAQEHFLALEREIDVYQAARIETFPELVTRAITTWSTNLLASLAWQGVGLRRDERGRWTLAGAYLRPRQETRYFHPGRMDADAIERVMCLPSALDDLCEPIAALEEALDQAGRASARRQEPILQACFERYPTLLAMGVYDRVVPRPKLWRPDPWGVPIVPDFVALNGVLPGLEAAAAVIELKSPMMRVRAARAAAAKFRQAIEQLDERYRNYFRDPRHAREQQARFGRTLHHPKLLLVIGRNAWADEWDELRKEESSRSKDDLRIVSYDDLSDIAALRHRTHERLRQAFAGPLP